MMSSIVRPIVGKLLTAFKPNVVEAPVRLDEMISERPDVTLISSRNVPASSNFTSTLAEEPKLVITPSFTASLYPTNVNVTLYGPPTRTEGSM